MNRKFALVLALVALVALAAAQASASGVISSDEIVKQLNKSEPKPTTRGIKIGTAAGFEAAQPAAQAAPQVQAAPPAAAPAKAAAAAPTKAAPTKAAPAKPAPAAEKPAIAFSINFQSRSAEIADDVSRQQLAEIGKALASPELAKSRFEIGGHTDNIGDAPYNMGLSQARAKTVRDYLMIKYDIKPDRLVTKGYGLTKPIASNADEGGRAKNRRVVITKLD